jgi:hypothetical protein
MYVDTVVVGPRCGNLYRLGQFIGDALAVALGGDLQQFAPFVRERKQRLLMRLFPLQQLFNPGGQQWPMRLFNGKVFAEVEHGALLDLVADTDGFDDPIGVVGFALVKRFGFGSSNIHAQSVRDKSTKIKAKQQIKWHYNAS